MVSNKFVFNSLITTISVKCLVLAREEKRKRKRRERKKRMKLLHLLAVPLAGARVIQLPVATESETETVSSTPLVLAGEGDTAPEVGVHFTTSYAVAAARYKNGTIRDVAKIEGDAEYVELMSQWMRSYSASSWEDDWSVASQSPP